MKNNGRSLYNADQGWDQLVKAGLIDSKTDKTRVIKENQEYELNVLN